MQKTIYLSKPIGETPLQTILKFKSKNPEYSRQTLSFAGRLDPMAEGLLLVLIGEENKKRKQYEALNKTYQFEVVFGVKTDSYDLLGIPTLRRKGPLNKTEKKKLELFLLTLIGKQNQLYPPFSSKTVHGKPLYYWARIGKISDLQIPSKTITIVSLKKHEESSISSAELLERCNAIIPTVSGQFRQEAIIQSWKKLIDENSDAAFSLFRFSITCSSGTYVRGIADQMGKHLGTEALAFSIKRTAIGDFTLDDALAL